MTCIIFTIHSDVIRFPLEISNNITTRGNRKHKRYLREHGTCVRSNEKFIVNTREFVF